MNPITLNPEREHYVISSGAGVTCFGFDNARDHARQIAARLGRPELALADGEHCRLAGYQKYLAALRAWGDSLQGRQTYFDPGTDARLARVLESCRRQACTVRLILGDTTTGDSWLDEHDVVGRIGRSTGTLKVPLLVEDGEAGGGAILCTCVLAVIDWQTGDALDRHPAYRPPELRIAPSGQAHHPWAVVLRDQAVANFADIGKAGAYLAFMRGACVEPRVFQ